MSWAVSWCSPSMTSRLSFRWESYVCGFFHGKQSSKYVNGVLTYYGLISLENITSHSEEMSGLRGCQQPKRSLVVLKQNNVTKEIMKH